MTAQVLPLTQPEPCGAERRGFTCHEVHPDRPAEHYFTKENR